MQPVELFNKEGKSVNVWYCGVCRIVHRSFEQAEKCCDYRCGVCGKECKQYWTKCDDCIAKERREKEKERFEKAEKLTNWDGWMYSEGLGYEDGFFEDVSDLIDYCEDEEIEIPEYVWVCNPNHFATADIEDLLSRIQDDAYEDFDVDCLSGLKELQEAIDKFNTANKDIVSWEPDYEKVVLIAHENQKS